MKPRLSRPVLAVVLGSALLAGGAAVASGPAYAVPAPPSATEPADEPVNPDVPVPTESVVPDETVAPPATTTPTTAPATTEPTTAAPGPTTPAPTTPAPEPTTPAPTTPAPTTPGPVDTTLPTGSLKISVYSLWVGQKTSVSVLNVADNGVKEPAAVTRQVWWGDGSAATLLKPGQSYAKSYARAGKFKITVFLTDAAKNRRTLWGTVTVTNPVKAKASKSAVWHGEKFKVTFSGVPKGTTRILLNYGDGYVQSLKPKNQTVEGLYHRRRGTNQIMPAGPVTLTATYTNRLGNTAAIPFARVTIKNDKWNPSIRIIQPKRPERASSWTALKGTVTDKGSGTRLVAAILFRVNASGSQVHCWTKNKTWLRVNLDLPLSPRCEIYVRPSKNKWSFKLKGVKKGFLVGAAVGLDWADRTGNVAELEREITR